MLIAFSGVDGSGKSTQIKLLDERMKLVGFKVVRIRCRWRPVISLPLLLVLRRLGYAKIRIAGGAYIVETRFPANARVLRSFWCFITQVENIVKAGPKLIIPLLLGLAVVSDRYVLDMLVDGKAGLHEPASGTRLGFRLLQILPQPDQAFLMDVDAEVAFGRKPDLPTIAAYSERLRLYRELSALHAVAVLDGSLPPRVIHESIWKTVSAAIGRDDRAVLTR